MKRLVFVPMIGFRPDGTRTLRQPAETTGDGTRLIVHAVAAAPDRTDAFVEWERTGDPATCPPDSQLLVHSNTAPMENGLTAALVTGSSRLDATAMRRRGMHVSHPSIGAIDMLTFPALPPDVGSAELRITEGGTEWRVALNLVRCEVSAMPLAGVELAREEVVVHVTAFAHFQGELIFEIEVVAPQQIRQTGAPVPSPARFTSTSDGDERERRKEMRRVFSEHARPITLEVDGARYEEVRRLFSLEPQQTAPGQPYVTRFVVMFDAPETEVGHATMVIPFVELNDHSPTATADLRQVPIDVMLAEHRFRVVAVEPYGADQQKVVIEMRPSTTAPRFVQPARIQGSDAEFTSGRHPVTAERTGSEAIWMATKVGDPPIVTFKGAVMRIEGPLRLELPLG